MRYGWLKVAATIVCEPLFQWLTRLWYVGNSGQLTGSLNACLFLFSKDPVNVKKEKRKKMAD